VGWARRSGREGRDAEAGRAAYGQYWASLTMRNRGNKNDSARLRCSPKSRDFMCRVVATY
jgi:hypothetical protein